MNAIQLLRRMHADTKTRFKIILGSDDPAAAAEQWQALQPLLELHEQLEDEFLYTPLFEEIGAGTPLGDWDLEHEADVAAVKLLIETTAHFDPTTPEWRMSVARVMDALNKHVTEEEGQIFGRIEQIWAPERLEEAGARMENLKDEATGQKVKPTRTRTAARTPATRRRGR
jgi:hypothetical protein